jgi:hypothetical protein
MSEEGEGGVFGLLTSSLIVSNGGKGAVYEEEGAGDVHVTVYNTIFGGNDGRDLGLEVLQDDEGEGSLVVSASDISDGVEAEGVETN